MRVTKINCVNYVFSTNHFGSFQLLNCSACFFHVIQLAFCASLSRLKHLSALKLWVTILFQGCCFKSEMRQELLGAQFLRQLPPVELLVQSQTFGFPAVLPGEAEMLNYRNIETVANLPC